MIAAWLTVCVFLFLLGLKGHQWVEADRFTSACVQLRTEALLAASRYPALLNNPQWQELANNLRHTAEHGPGSLWVLFWESYRLPSVEPSKPSTHLPSAAAELLDELCRINGQNLIRYYAIHNPIMAGVALGYIVRSLVRVPGRSTIITAPHIHARTTPP